MCQKPPIIPELLRCPSEVLGRDGHGALSIGHPALLSLPQHSPPPWPCPGGCRLCLQQWSWEGLSPCPAEALRLG